MAASGLTKGRVSQLLDESEVFGERAARSLEERLGLAVRALDQAAGDADSDQRQRLGPMFSVPLPPPSLSEAIAAVAAAVQALSREARQSLSPALAALAVAPDSAALREELLRALEPPVAAAPADDDWEPAASRHLNETIAASRAKRTPSSKGAGRK